MSLRRLAPPAAVLAATVVAAGCGGDSGSGEPVATTSVRMAKSYRFDPTDISVKAGDAVTWTNDDNFTHTVKFDDRPDHKVDRGDSVSITFSEAGTYHYVCTLHSNDMSGTVVVA